MFDGSMLARVDAGTMFLSQCGRNTQCEGLHSFGRLGRNGALLDKERSLLGPTCGKSCDQN